jgi:hypothetical protein
MNKNYRRIGCAGLPVSLILLSFPAAYLLSVGDSNYGIKDFLLFLLLLLAGASILGISIYRLYWSNKIKDFNELSENDFPEIDTIKFAKFKKYVVSFNKTPEFWIGIICIILAYIINILIKDDSIIKIIFPAIFVIIVIYSIYKRKKLEKEAGLNRKKIFNALKMKEK